MDRSTHENIILLADSYKISHHRQYPPGTSTIYSYFESRGGRFPYTVFFGLQYILKKWLIGPVVTKEKIQEAKEFFAEHLRNDSIFNEDGWTYILEKHGGYLPLKVKAIAEGTVIPTKNVLFTVENTDPMVPWLTSYFETIFVQTWYPMTVATNSRIQKQIIHKYMQDTHDSFDGIEFMLHDFGYRGVSSVESAAIGGAGHLVNFQGSDTIGGIMMLKQYYNATCMPAFSIPAAEHSTITSWGKEGELDACRNMIESFPEGHVGVVSDSYDIFNCCDNIWGQELNAIIKKRGEKGGVLVIRPDSGDPAEIVIKCLDILSKHFPITINSKGYKMLPSYLKIIQGDGISYKSLSKILNHLKLNMWSAANVLYGSGGSLIQKVDRDTQKCAYKCSHAIINGEGHDIFKQPITDLGKTSKKGMLTLECNDGIFRTVEKGEGDPSKDLLVPVFENGKLLVDQNLDEIRKRAEISQNDIDIMKFLESAGC